MQKIMPSLWFDKDAEESVNLYAEVFKDVQIGKTTRYGKEGFEVHGMPEGTVMTIEFSLFGHNYLAMNGGPVFKFNESVSFIIDCKDQEEVDYYWDALTANGGTASQCGWLKDKFGLSWQVTPRQLNELMSDPDPKKAGAVMNAMLKMQKIVIADLQAAYDAA